MNPTIERLEFQAEARQLLDLMVHSIYSNKDVFLRELISNASDALDKLRIEALQHTEWGIDLNDLHIRLATDPGARTLTVNDNGIGMTRDEVVGLIGTIARSGTAEFMKASKAAASTDPKSQADLIGQFGVGFYSTFMVADRVTLTTRRAGQEGAIRWESTGDGTYTLEAVAEAPVGTSITLHLKPEDRDNHLFDYTSEWKLREIVKTYSDFISYPVRMDVVRTRTEGEGDDAKTVTESKTETLNSMKALWARSKDEVAQEEYNEFYRHISHDWTEPMSTIQMKAEGTFEYETLLFVPGKAPYDLFSPEGKRGLQLYVKRVFIMDECEELMPSYLRFVKGVVDAHDLSLNVSREILQKDRHIEMIRKRLVKKVLSTLQELRDEEFQAATSEATPEVTPAEASEGETNDGAESTPVKKYSTFWREFGRVLKEGLINDYDNRETLLELVRAHSTHDSTQLTSLADYVSRMKEGQEAIYFLAGESLAALQSSPHLEAFRSKGVEVLLFADPVDEVWTQSGATYQDKPLQSVAKGEVELGTEEEKKQAAEARDEQQKGFASLLTWMGTRLKGEVKEVRLSSRLTTSPACLVGDSHDMTPQLEKLMKAMGQTVPQTLRILELNPQHALVTRLQAAYAARPDDAHLGELVELLYGQALLAEGGELTDPARFSRLLAETLTRLV